MNERNEVQTMFSRDIVHWKRKIIDQYKHETIEDDIENLDDFYRFSHTIQSVLLRRLKIGIEIVRRKLVEATF